MAPAKNFRLSDSPGGKAISETATLWQRIESFSLDDTGAAFPFSRRLAKENRWPIERARRAIVEYKKFMFLGCVAGHPVSPSEVVDQVWHLHLTYSESYWKKWCVEILERPFHHHPTRGGSSESAKFEDWYANTLRSYEKFFGEEPPIDVWPRNPEHHRLAWVDIDAHWVVPRPTLASLRATAPAALALFVTGCVGAAGLNVFDYKGSEFLRFYIFFSVIAFAVAIGIRLLATRSVSAPASIKPDDLDPYELAMLTGSDRLAVSAAMMNLEKAGLLMVVNRKLRIVGNIPSTAAPLEGYAAEVCQRSQQMSGVRRVRAACRHFTQGMERSLAARGLLLDGAARTVNLLLPPLIAWAVPICGWIKVFVGIQRDKPVLYVTVLSILATVIAAIITRRTSKLSAAGKRLINRARQKYRSLKNFRDGDERVGGDVALPLAVGLFGLAALGTSSWRQRARALGITVPTPSDSGGFGWSGCGDSGSGSSSSGGGSSCGGGGGSGCGGCGGGGD